MNKLMWVNVSFSPCPIGWRVVYKNEQEPTKPFIFAMAGWLTQREVELDSNGNYLNEDKTQYLRVIAADYDGSTGEVQPVSNSCLLAVLAPGVEFDPKQWEE